MSLRSHPTIRTLFRIDGHERKRLLSWLESELYVHRRGLAALARAVYASEAKDAATFDARLRKKGAMDGPEHQLKLRLSYLGEALDTFLGLEEVVDDPLEVSRRAGLSLAKKGDFRRAEKNRKKASKKAAQDEERPHEVTLQLFLLEWDRSNWPAPGQALDLEQIERTDHRLNTFFLLHKLQQACRFVAYGTLNNVHLEIPFLEECLREVATKPEVWLQDPLIALYYYSYLTLSDRGENAHEQLALQLFNRPKFLRSEAVRELFLALINHANRKLNTGDQSYARSSFELYKVGIAENVLFTKGHLSGPTYVNLIHIGSKLREFEWLRWLLDRRVEWLTPTDQEVYYPYCEAVYQYETGELETASDLLAAYHNTTSKAMYLQTRVTLAKVYYDQRAHELLDALLNSLTVFISRNRRIGYHGEIFLGFIRLCRRLLNLPPGSTVEKRDALRTEIDALPVRSMRDWLLERLEQLTV